MKKHEQIEHIILYMLEHELLYPGSPVPSIREMATMYNMSVTPVIEAYHTLEQRGILVSKPRNGFVVSDAAARIDVMESAAQRETPHFSNLDSTRYIATDSTVKYPFGQPECCVSPSSNAIVLQRLCRALKKAVEPEKMMSDTRGSDSLCEELCKWMIKYSNIVDKQNILPINSSMHSALMLILQCCTSHGDEVGVAEPGNIDHYLAIRAKGLIPVPIRHIPEQGLDLDNFERVIKNHPQMKCVICSPNFDSPTGSLMPERSRRRFVELCRRNSIIIVEDDCNGSLNFEGFRPSTIFSIAPERTIYLAGLNFTHTKELRIHWVCSQIFTNELRYYHDIMNLTPPAHLRNAYAELINSNLTKKRRLDAGARCARTCDCVREAVYESFPDGTYVYTPSGGYSIWIKLPRGCDALTLLKIVLERYDLTFAPGRMFSCRGEFGDHIRLNCSIMDGYPDWRNGIQKLGDTVYELIGDGKLKNE